VGSDRLMNTVAKWIRAGRLESNKQKASAEAEEQKKGESPKEIVPDGSAGGYAPGRLAYAMNREHVKRKIQERGAQRR